MADYTSVKAKAVRVAAEADLNDLLPMSPNQFVFAQSEGTLHFYDGATFRQLPLAAGGAFEVEWDDIQSVPAVVAALPALPGTGTFVLTSTEDVLSWEPAA